jgi:hypothetical protein
MLMGKIATLFAEVVVAISPTPVLRQSAVFIVPRLMKLGR